MYGQILSTKRTNSNCCDGTLPLGITAPPPLYIYPLALSLSSHPLLPPPSHSSPPPPSYPLSHLNLPSLSQSPFRERKDFANGMSYQFFKFTLVNPTAHWRIDLGNRMQRTMFLRLVELNAQESYESKNVSGGRNGQWLS